MRTRRDTTYIPKLGELKPRWHVIDASEQPIGRLATQVARILQGKHVPYYTPFLNTGDFVVVTNAARVRVVGSKDVQKVYYRHSGYHGGLRVITLREMLDQHPERAIEHAVKGMLPKTAMGRAMLKRLKVYPGQDHPHQSQVREPSAPVTAQSRP